METRNKQWTCNNLTNRTTEIHGQPGPEDLSAATAGKNETKKPFNNVDADENPYAKNAKNENHNYNGNRLDEILAHQIENVICENSRKTITQILEEIEKLSSTEKLLLYLKLPTDLANVTDPLRQPLNPLGSRTEISQTIMWIRTHLEEDPELSLPKQEVYTEYTMHCSNNKMKPLSTADFGKVMKQVYPSVRPRRLGTRGNSRYCYAGLRKRFKLEVPQLPDLAGKMKNNKDSIVQSSTELNSAAWFIVQKWAENILGTTFVNMCSLAVYLLKNICPVVSSQSAAAAALLTNLDSSVNIKGDNCDATSQSNVLNLKHKETQIQLQKKLQEREVTREQKRKLQIHISVRKNSEAVPKVTSGKCKKTKISPTNLTDDSSTITSQQMEGFPLPNFSSFQLKKQLSPDAKPNLSFNPDVKPNDAGKIAIPRLPNIKVKQIMSQIKNVPHALRTKSRNQQKYKAIQPKPVVTQEANSTQVDSSEVMSSIDEDQLKDIDYLTRERLISVSNVDKDALDDYLHGDNNSQEQEEELLQYFNNETGGNEAGKEDESSNGSKSDKLSQLRLLLEQNLNPGLTDVQSKHILMRDEKQFLSRIQMSSVKRRVSFETADTVPPSPNTRRKNFSFTPISPGPHSPSGIHSKPSSTNASPFVSPRNTPVPRAKTVSHTMTSYVQQQKMKKSLKRNIVPKSEPELYMEQTPDPLPHNKPFIAPLNLIPKCNLPMSAPPSPMLTCKQKTVNQSTNLLQKLLDSNAKVPYVPDYDKTNIQNQEVGQLMNTVSEYPTTTATFRSQSVPLHQMAPFKTLASPCVPTTPQTQFNFNFDNTPVRSVPPTPAPTAEFSDFETFTDTDMLNNGLNNDNINQILNILDTTAQNNEERIPAENVFSFPDTNITPFNELQPGIIQHTNIENPKPVRSQSIEEHIVDLDLQNMRQQKLQMSRSVPNTPLPYKTKLELNLNNNQIGNVFNCNEEQDFLLNGQPVKKKFIMGTDGIENNSFPQSLGFMMNENIVNLDDGFNERRNLNSLLDQDFAEPDDFTAVPNLNSGS